MGALEDAKERVESLERQDQLERELAEAADAHVAEPSAEALAAHNAAAEALAAHRAAQRSAGGPKVGGDTVATPDRSEGGEA